MIADLGDTVIDAIHFEAFAELWQRAGEGGLDDTEAQIRRCDEAAEVDLLLRPDAAEEDIKIESFPSRLNAVFGEELLEVGDDVGFEAHVGGMLSK